MAVEFHCQNCKKKIKAPDEACGKWGKCPHCNMKCYIPMPQSDAEEIKLAPIDQQEEIHYHRMMRQSYNITENLLHETAEPEEPGNRTHADEKQLRQMIIKYLRYMADGQLDAAGYTAEQITMYRTQTRKILKSMTAVEISEKELKNVPPKLLGGFIRNLLTRLS